MGGEYLFPFIGVKVYAEAGPCLHIVGEIRNEELCQAAHLRVMPYEHNGFILVILTDYGANVMVRCAGIQ